MIGAEQSESAARLDRANQIRQHVGLRFVPLVDLPLRIVADHVEIAQGRKMQTDDRSYRHDRFLALQFRTPVRVGRLLRMVLADGLTLGIAIGGARTGKDQLPGPGPFHGLEQGYGPANVVVEVFFREPGGFLDIGFGGKVDYGVHLKGRQGLKQSLLMADIAVYERTEFHPFRPSIGKIVKDNGSMPSPLE